MKVSVRAQVFGHSWAYGVWEGMTAMGLMDLSWAPSFFSLKPVGICSHILLSSPAGTLAGPRATGARLTGLALLLGRDALILCSF